MHLEDRQISSCPLVAYDLQQVPEPETQLHLDSGDNDTDLLLEEKKRGKSKAQEDSCWQVRTPASTHFYHQCGFGKIPDCKLYSGFLFPWSRMQLEH